MAYQAIERLRRKIVATVIRRYSELLYSRIGALGVKTESGRRRSWLSGETGVEYFKPAPNDLLQKWSVSKRVNSSRADDDDPTLIEKLELAPAIP
jgi:hypothetical protein